MNYQDKMDNIFAKGNLWSYRTFRTVLDPNSSEYADTTMEQKVDFVKICHENDLMLTEIIIGYKEFYFEENKSHVIDSLEDGLIRLITKLMQENK